MNNIKGKNSLGKFSVFHAQIKSNLYVKPTWLRKCKNNTQTHTYTLICVCFTLSLMTSSHSLRVYNFHFHFITYFICTVVKMVEAVIFSVAVSWMQLGIQMEFFSHKVWRFLMSSFQYAWERRNPSMCPCEGEIIKKNCNKHKYNMRHQCIFNAFR